MMMMTRLVLFSGPKPLANNQISTPTPASDSFTNLRR